MKTFQIWVESRQKQEIADTLVSQLGLNKETGLSAPLDSFDPSDLASKIQGLGIWRQLSPEKQAAVKGKIDNQQGTIGDLVDEMIEIDTSGNLGGVSPPIGV